MDFHGAFSLINEKEEDKYTISEVVYELWIIYGFYKENTKLGKLNSFFWVQWFIWGGIPYLMIYEWNMRSGESCDSEIIFIRSSYCSLCYFELRYISFGLKPLLLTQFKMYQIYLFSQSSVLTVILSQAVHKRALNSYQQPISKKAKTTPSFVPIKAFSLVISINSLLSILISFTLYQSQLLSQFRFEIILKYLSYVCHLITQFLLHILLPTQLCE